MGGDLVGGPADRAGRRGCGQWGGDRDVVEGLGVKWGGVI